MICTHFKKSEFKTFDFNLEPERPLHFFLRLFKIYRLRYILPCCGTRTDSDVTAITHWFLSCWISRFVARRKWIIYIAGVMKNVSSDCFRKVEHTHTDDNDHLTFFGSSRMYIRHMGVVGRTTPRMTKKNLIRCKTGWMDYFSIPLLWWSLVCSQQYVYVVSCTHNNPTYVTY